MDFVKSLGNSYRVLKFWEEILKQCKLRKAENVVADESLNAVAVAKEARNAVAEEEGNAVTDKSLNVVTVAEEVGNAVAVAEEAWNVVVVEVNAVAEAVEVNSVKGNEVVVAVEGNVVVVVAEVNAAVVAEEGNAMAVAVAEDALAVAVAEDALAVIPRRCRIPRFVVRRPSRRSAYFLARRRIAAIYCEVEEEENGEVEE